MATSTLFDLKPAKLNYSPFMISLDKSSESFNAVNVLSMKTCVPCETKDVNFKVFNMITARMKLKHWWNICHAIVNANSIIKHASQIKIGIMINLNESVKSAGNAKKKKIYIYIYIVGILAHVFARMVSI